MKEKLFKFLKTFLPMTLVVMLIISTISPPSEAATNLSTPTLVSVSNTSSGVTVKWKKVSNASGYYVYRKTGSDKWSKIATIKKNSTVSYADKDVAAGKTYTYTVKACKGRTTSSYNKTGLTIKRLTQPSPTVKNSSSGVKISWKKVTGASKYRVYFKVDGKWKKLADTTSTSYTDKSVKSGSSRTYTVKAFSENYGSSYVSGKKITYLSQPDPSVSNTSNGVNISWSKVTGAKTYRVYYKNDSGKWVKLADITSTSYTDKTVKSGESRTYTVKAINEKYVSSYNPKGNTIMYLAQPKAAASNTSSGVKITWNKVSGASKYCVYYMNMYVEGGNKNRKWEKLTDTTSTSFIYKGFKSGMLTCFAVKAINGDFTSALEDSCLLDCLKQPEPKAESVSNGVKISWDDVIAGSYRIYYKKDDKWTKLADTESTSYIDTTIKKGETRTYTVKAYGVVSTSSYCSGVSATY